MQSMHARMQSMQASIGIYMVIIRVSMYVRRHENMCVRMCDILCL